MHTEHLTNLHPGWALGGWLVALAVTSLLYIALVGTGLLPPGSGTALGAIVSMGAGFYAGGLFIGFRWGSAPILHGAAITFISILVWFLGSVIWPGAFGGAVDATATVPGVILLQFLASAAGGWTAARLTGAATSEIS